MGENSTDASDSADPSRIDELEQQIAFLRHALDKLSPSLQGLKGSDAAGLIGYAADPPAIDAMTGKPRRPPTSEARGRLVREYVRRRKMRSDLFRAEYFADPVWDMMLDLYAAHHETQLVSVSSLCIASGVPATTALRWIKALTAEGVVIRARDDSDGRRVYVHLGAETHAKLDAYFDAIEA
ncbi:MAG: hypothetical protein JHD35_07840 [Sphingopyxis sp.]|nr:hypothetical protein [Sphingopyxis sp.]